MCVAQSFDIPERIVTERLVLRRQTRSDAQMMRVAIEESIDELSQWLTWAKEIPSLETLEGFIAASRAAWELREKHIFHVFDHADRFVGLCGLESIDWALRGFEIGYWLRTSSTGKGYMTEAVLALENWVFEVNRGRRLVIKCDALNTRSAAIATRLGYDLEGILRSERLNSKNEPQDTMVWAKVRP